MGIKQLFNNFLVSAVFLVSFLCCDQAVQAEQLLFKAGDKASYTISQMVNLDFEESFINEASNTQSETVFDVDICVLSTNEEALGYPLEVEVTLKTIILNEIEQDGKSTTTIHYDSTEAKRPENRLLAAQLDKLVNSTLNFRVGKGFDVQETSGYLTEIDEDLDSPLSVRLQGVLRLLLIQLFHLSGEDLLLSNSYPVSCHEFIDFEDDPLEKDKTSIEQNSAYTIMEMDSERILGTWNREAKIDSAEEELEGEVILVGHVTWDKAHPLMQQRDLSVTIIERDTDSFPTQIKASIQQTLTPNAS